MSGVFSVWAEEEELLSKVVDSKSSVWKKGFYFTVACCANAELTLVFFSFFQSIFAWLLVVTLH